MLSDPNPILYRKVRRRPVLDRASGGWRGLAMTPKALRLLQDLRRQLLHPPITEGVIDEAVTAAA